MVGVRLNVDKVKLIWSLYHSGLTHGDIAGRVGCHENTVYRVLKRGEPVDASKTEPISTDGVEGEDVLSKMKVTLIGLFNVEADSDRKRRLAETIATLDSEILKRTPVEPLKTEYVVSCLPCPEELYDAWREIFLYARTQGEAWKTIMEVRASGACAKYLEYARELQKQKFKVETVGEESEEPEGPEKTET